MRYSRIPNETIRRLPIYLRGLAMLARQGLNSVSSGKLADFVNVPPFQIRKDFSYFGDFGTRGVGYDIANLSRQIKKILNLESGHKAALVGVGNLGSAVLAYPGFKIYGFQIEAAFDNNPAVTGRKVGGILVEDISKINTLAKRGVMLAIIAVPEQAAQQVADELVAAGIKGILNFSPKRITVPKKVKVITIDIATDLARLPYYIPSS
ncbi:MAG: redox-sensing transcriptional repressor Rex [Sedimentisphaerales bacterium]